MNSAELSAAKAFAQMLCSLSAGNRFEQQIPAPMALSVPIVPSMPGGSARRESAQYIVVEEPFGRERQEMRAAIDLVAIIDLPLEVALARRIRRNIQPALEDGAASAECLRSLGSFLDGYLDQQIREAYLVINHLALATYDIILDGMQPIDALAEQVAEAVRLMRR